MRIVNLMEDTKGENNTCIYQHGLSFYIETEHHKLLMDTGASEDFLQNARILGVDLTKVDTVIISHGHYDHTGGLMEFAKQNPDAVIYMHKLAGRAYYHVNAKEERYIGIEPEILKLKNLVFVDEDRMIDEEVSLFTGVTGRRLWPKGNQELKLKLENGTYVQDDFSHEQYLVVQERGKVLLCSGCAHNGILNIMERCCSLYGKVPDLVMSGFHMMQKSYFEEDYQAIRETGRLLKKYSSMFYTGHCTGSTAYELLKKEMGEQVAALHCGDEVIL